jgi:hypothetical protein
MYSLLQTPPIELKLGQQRGAGTTTNSKPPGTINHYDGPIRNTEQQSDHIYYTLFCKCTARATNVHNCVEPNKTIFLSQTGICWVFFIQFNSARSHTYISTVGDALRSVVKTGGSFIKKSRTAQHLGSYLPFCDSFSVISGFGALSNSVTNVVFSSHHHHHHLPGISSFASSCVC